MRESQIKIQLIEGWVENSQSLFDVLQYFILQLFLPQFSIFQAHSVQVYLCSHNNQQFKSSQINTKNVLLSQQTNGQIIPTKLKYSALKLQKRQVYFYSTFILKIKFMRINRQRNLYLQQIFSQQPHRYSYDISKGKYTIISKEGTQCAVNSNGTLPSKWRPQYTGCVDNKIRLNDLKNNPASFYFAPNAQSPIKQNTLLQQKFIGYAQFPYSINQSPSHLRQSKVQVFTSRAKPKRSFTQKREETPLQRSQIIRSLKQYRDQKQFLTRAWGSITNSKPSPRQKKSCYDQRCNGTVKRMINLQRRMGNSRRLKKTCLITANQILSKSFHEDRLKLEQEEIKRILEMSTDLQKTK